MSHDLNNSNFDSFDEEIENVVNAVLEELSNKFAESRMLQMVLDGIKGCNREMAAENRELKLQIETMNERANIREELNEALRTQLKYLKEKHARMTAFKNKSFEELASEFASQLALNRAAYHRSLQAPPQPQPPMPPSTPDQPPNEQPGPTSSN